MNIEEGVDVLLAGHAHTDGLWDHGSDLTHDVVGILKLAHEDQRRTADVRQRVPRAPAPGRTRLRVGEPGPLIGRDDAVEEPLRDRRWLGRDHVIEQIPPAPLAHARQALGGRRDELVLIDTPTHGTGEDQALDEGGLLRGELQADDQAVRPTVEGDALEAQLVAQGDHIGDIPIDVVIGDTRRVIAASMAAVIEQDAAVLGRERLDVAGRTPQLAVATCPEMEDQR